MSLRRLGNGLAPCPGAEAGRRGKSGRGRGHAFVPANERHKKYGAAVADGAGGIFVDIQQEKLIRRG